MLISEINNRVLSSLKKADEFETKLSDEVFYLEGMSGRKSRIFLNEVCSHSSIQYLEIGSWRGSTAIASSFKNDGKFVAVDNFEQFDGDKNILLSNIKRFDCKVNVIETDFRKVSRDLIDISPNVYFFDGPHSTQDHEDAITLFKEVISDECLIIIDDWNGKEAKEGTRKGFLSSGLKVHYSYDINDKYDSDRIGYWNGLGLFIVSK